MESFLLALFNIIIIDLVLSGDNAVVIGMAVHRLPPRQKRIAVLSGGGLALILRIALTALAAFLLQIPLLQAGGALVLVWITYRLLTESSGEEGHAQDANTSFFQAMRTIIIADVTMSTDNVLAVGAAAKDEYWLLIFGLALSMAILVAGGTLVSVLITKVSWLNYVGAAVLVILSGQMLAEDKWLLANGFLPHFDLLPWIFSAIIGLVLLTLVLLRRRRQHTRVGANATLHSASEPLVDENTVRIVTDEQRRPINETDSNNSRLARP